MIEAPGRRPKDEQVRCSSSQVTSSDDHEKGNVFGLEVLFIGLTGHAMLRIRNKTHPNQELATHFLSERSGAYLAWEIGAGKTP